VIVKTQIGDVETARVQWLKEAVTYTADDLTQEATAKEAGKLEAAGE
jgi:hypothetical protein